MKALLTFVATMAITASLTAATPDQLFAAGRAALAENDTAKAVELFEQAIKAKPNDAQYHYWLGQAYGREAMSASIFGKAGFAGKSKAEFLRAVELDPNYLDGRFGLLEFYLEAPGIVGGSDEKALEQAQEIRKRDPLMGHNAFARIYTKEKKPELARKEHYDAVREQPNSAKAHQALGVYLMLEKDYKDALAEYETALKLDGAYMPAYFQIGHTAALASTNFVRGEEALKKYLGYKPLENEPSLARAWFWLGRIYEAQGRKADAKQSY
ncbi:MAG TPA: tetratricopeptide repeat protein, partial [Thermoanaerobaculia bacterium]